MKIKLPNGVEVTLEGVDEITATLPALQILTGGGSIESSPRITDNSSDIGDRPVPPTHVRRGPTQNRTLNPPTPGGRWPDLIYMTKEWIETLILLRQYPEGITSEEIGIGMGLDQSLASGRVNRLRRATPLVEEIGGKYRVTMIGADDSVRIEVAHNPSVKNKRLGWDRFMAIPLPDGRHKRRRLS
jgi:hypothetical protein